MESEATSHAITGAVAGATTAIILGGALVVAVAPSPLTAAVLIAVIAGLAAWTATRSVRRGAERRRMRAIAATVNRTIGEPASDDPSAWLETLDAGVQTLDRAMTARNDRLNALDSAIRGEVARRTNRMEERGRAWEALLARLSYEARTSLATLRSGIEDLERSAQETPGTESMHGRSAQRAMSKGIDRLHRLLVETIDLARLESGQVEPVLEEVGVAPLVADVLEDCLSTAVGTGVGVTAHAVDPIPDAVRVDGDRVRRLLGDLLVHIVRLSAGTGNVTMELSRTLGPDHPSTAEGATARRSTTVREVAVGMPAPSELSILMYDDAGVLQPEAIEANWPVLASTASPTNADGDEPWLGLVIARTVARNLGLSLSVDRLSDGRHGFRVGVPFDGTDRPHVSPERFDASLQAINSERRTIEQRRRTDIAASLLDRAAQSESEAGDRPGHLSGVRVLVIEDHADVRRLMIRHLGRAGAEVDVASDGAEGLVAIESAEVAGRPFDLAVVDLRLPGVSGLEVVRRVRETRRGTGLLVLTASAMAGDRERSLDAGADAYMSKPFQAQELIDGCLEVAMIAMTRSGRSPSPKAGADDGISFVDQAGARIVGQVEAQAEEQVEEEVQDQTGDRADSDVHRAAA